jgi:hypothetical protein
MSEDVPNTTTFRVHINPPSAKSSPIPEVTRYYEALLAERDRELE